VTLLRRLKLESPFQQMGRLKLESLLPQTGRLVREGALRRRLPVGLVLLGVLTLPASAAATVDIRVRTTPESLTVGDRVTVEVQVDAPAGAQVTFPQPPASRWAEVLDLQTIPPADEGTADAEKSSGSGAAAMTHSWTGRYTLALFGVGDVVLPPWTVKVQADTSVTAVHTDSLRFFVASVLDDSLAAADIRDLKPQQDVRVPLPLWVWILAAAVLLTILVVWWIRRRRSRRVVVAPLAPPVSAQQWALTELAHLENRKLPLDGKFKEHHVRLSEILRGYLERAPQFGFTALEQTSAEILRELRQREYKQDVQDELARLCEEADLVKFAKHEPSVDECDEALERVRHFVMQSAQSTSAALRESEPVALEVP